MPPDTDSQQLKGVLPMLVLGALGRAGESYGYELAGVLRAAGLTDLTTGTLYPVLNRLERDGFVTARLVASDAGPARKYYTPTSGGRAELDRASTAWSALSETVARVLSTGPLPTTEETAP